MGGVGRDWRLEDTSPGCAAAEFPARVLSLHREDLTEFSLVGSGAEVLGAGRSAEDGGMDGAA